MSSSPCSRLPSRRPRSFRIRTACAAAGLFATLAQSRPAHAEKPVLEEVTVAEQTLSVTAPGIDACTMPDPELSWIVASSMQFESLASLSTSGWQRVAPQNMDAEIAKLAAVGQRLVNDYKRHTACPARFKRWTDMPEVIQRLSAFGKNLPAFKKRAVAFAREQNGKDWAIQQNHKGEALVNACKDYDRTPVYAYVDEVGNTITMFCDDGILLRTPKGVFEVSLHQYRHPKYDDFTAKESAALAKARDALDDAKARGHNEAPYEAAVKSAELRYDKAMDRFFAKYYKAYMALYKAAAVRANLTPKTMAQ